MRASALRTRSPFWSGGLAEFTGERVIPGRVDVDLLNEHMARYTFAARLTGGKRVLDAGCGAGSGSAELAARARLVVGIDVSADAIDFARENYPLGNLRFERGSCSSLPHPEASFDLVVAFEVIEHLENWRELLAEARRVLAPGGRFIVSTPNRLYYTESRGATGANPFHVHEFDYREFAEELGAVFPRVQMFLENHVEGVTFQPAGPASGVEARVDASDPAPDEAHFFLAVCGAELEDSPAAFLYVPRAANVLRERERHIALLETEIATKNQWLEKAVHEHQDLLAQFRDQKEALDRSNQWNQSLNRDIAEQAAQIQQLQEEMEREQQAAEATASAYEAKVRELEQDVAAKVQWARDVEAALTADVQKQTAALQGAVDALHHTEKELEDRTAWAQRLEQEASGLGHQLALVRQSRWMKLGRKVGLGPVLPTDS